MNLYHISDFYLRTFIAYLLDEEFSVGVFIHEAIDGPGGICSHILSGRKLFSHRWCLFPCGWPLVKRCWTESDSCAHSHEPLQHPGTPSQLLYPKILQRKRGLVITEPMARNASGLHRLWHRGYTRPAGNIFRTWAVVTHRRHPLRPATKRWLHYSSRQERPFDILPGLCWSKRYRFHGSSGMTTRAQRSWLKMRSEKEVIYGWKQTTNTWSILEVSKLRQHDTDTAAAGRMPGLPWEMRVSECHVLHPGVRVHRDWSAPEIGSVRFKNHCRIDSVPPDRRRHHQAELPARQAERFVGLTRWSRSLPLVVIGSFDCMGGIVHPCGNNWKVNSKIKSPLKNLRKQKSHPG